MNHLRRSRRLSYRSERRWSPRRSERSKGSTMPYWSRRLRQNFQVRLSAPVTTLVYICKYVSVCMQVDTCRQAFINHISRALVALAGDCCNCSCCCCCCRRLNIRPAIFRIFILTADFDGKTFVNCFQENFSYALHCIRRIQAHMTGKYVCDVGVVASLTCVCVCVYVATLRHAANGIIIALFDDFLFFYCRVR